MTVKEVADELSMSPYTIWKWIRLGENNFPVKRLGQRVLVPRAKFETWCESENA